MVKVYISNLLLSIKSIIEYKSSFIMQLICQTISLSCMYFTIYALFQRFSNIKGFSVYEVLLCFAIVTFGMSFNETFFRGIDKFDDFVYDGSLDRFLIRPCNVLISVMSSRVDLVRIIKVIESIVIMIISLINLNITMNLLNIFILIIMLLSSIFIFLGVFILSASYCFLSVNGLEFRNVLVDGGYNLAQYPIGIFKKGILMFFTFIIPYSAVNYYPLLYFLGKSNNILYLFSPIIVIIFLYISIKIFNLGLKRYKSCG